MDDRTREAIDRIARSADGHTLHRHLQEVLSLICHDFNEGALRHHEGRRSLARDLMAAMAEGIEASGGRTDTVIGRRDGEQPRRKLSAREWIARNEPSWVDQPNAGDQPAAKPS